MTAVPSVVILGAEGEPTIIGLTLTERAVRAAVATGASRATVHVVRGPVDLERARAAVLGPIVVIRAADPIVMPDLYRALEPRRPGSRVAVDPVRGGYAGALYVDLAHRDGLWRALDEDRDAGDRRFAAALLAAEPGGAVDVLPTARHPAAPDERRAATAWLWQFVDKPHLDAPLTRYFFRPVGRPLTRLFVRLPFTPNQITLASIAIAMVGCVIASRPGYGTHLAGITLISLVSGVLDTVDGEVARVRLQGSRLGAWLDAVSDDVLRLCLMVALGSHVAPSFPRLPTWPLAIGSVVLTVATMLPMYWYCVRVLGTPNTQNYMTVLDGGARRGGLALGRMVSGRDFVDVGTLVLALAGIPIVGVLGFAIGSIAGVAVIIPAHVAIVRGGAHTRAARC